MAEETTITRPAPFIEEAGKVYTDKLFGTSKRPGILGRPVDTSQFAPSVAGLSALQKAGMQQQATQAGLGNISYDQTTGLVSDVGQGTGIASYQPYLSAASTAGRGLSQAASMGQGAGNQAIQGAGLNAAALGMAGVAGQNVGDANLQAAGGLTGPGAGNAFMSPYQQQVIDATQASYQNQRAQGRQSIADAAIQAGAFGGGREGVQRGVYDAQTTLGATQLEADLRAQNFAQAQNQANTAFGQQTNLAGLQQQQATQNQALYQNSMAAQGQLAGLQQGQSAQNQALYQNALAGQSGLATLTPQLQQQQAGQIMGMGQQQQALRQSQLDAQAAANRESAYEEQQRIGFAGQQFAPLMGGIGASTQYSTATATPPSTLQTILGTGTGIAGIAGAFNKGFG
tara:strand:- start:856 stop:2052 length:1197 start_codon:yes stop_codon:yes gene_type:complete